MKKIFALGAIITFFAISASAQGPGDRYRRERIHHGFETGQLTRGERMHLNRSEYRYKAEKRRAFRDGRISPMERRKLSMMKRHNNRETFRMKHNRRHRVI